MIAEAIQDARPDWRTIQVDLATIRWSNPRTRKRYVALTPELAGAALVEFDQGRTVEPFSFNLDWIQSTPMKRGAKNKDAQPRGSRQGVAGREDHGGAAARARPSAGRRRRAIGQPRGRQGRPAG